MKNKNFDVWLGIGLNILHYRKEQGMTQIQLAEKCNISRTYMQKIETAACSCTLDTLNFGTKNKSIVILQMIMLLLCLKRVMLSNRHPLKSSYYF